MRQLSILTGLTATFLLTGCMRTNTETVIADDGAWNRTVKFTIQKEDMMGKPSKFDDVVFLPSGADWKTSQATEKENLVFTATRAAKLGETLTDDLRLKEKGKAILSNTVTVRDLGNGRYEYLETIRYTGEAKPKVSDSRAEVRRAVRDSLGSVTASDAQLDDIMQGAMLDLWRIVFGPTKPLLPTLAMHPDLGERELRRRFGQTMESQFERVLGDKMDKPARLATVRKMVSLLDSEKIMGSPKEQAPSEPGEDGGAGLISMTTIVKLPGRIVESNGEIDEVANEVFWAFYSESTYVGELTLRAVCEVKP